MKKTIALIVAAISLALSGCCTARHSTIWEYQTVTNISDVNRLAAEGWTLAGFSSQGNGAVLDRLVYVMKHPKR
ncbi:MAG: hypothetical protein MUE94_05080 [Verrucomicrobia bacterium]|jgi:hypothetical protein|nr:hypothetical protein [Verrucomicrobiota bacterium]